MSDNLELAFQFLADNEVIASEISGEAFQAFWTSPVEVIALYEAITKVQQQRLGLPPEVIKQMAAKTLQDACMEYSKPNS